MLVVKCTSHTSQPLDAGRGHAVRLHDRESRGAFGCAMEVVTRSMIAERGAPIGVKRDQMGVLVLTLR